MLFIAFKESIFPARLILSAEEVRNLAKDVLCEVSNCTFWDSGNKCAADTIYVVSHKGKQASDHEETDCRTFEPVK